MELSQLKIYSLGIVAANKALTSRDVSITPVEDTPMVNGEITDDVTKYKADAADSDGKAYSVELDTTNTVTATWLPLGSSNRMTAPDVRRGETVVLYRFADSDKFWWTTLKDDMNLRKLETVIYAFSGTKDENAKSTSENCYFLEVSTHQKLVHFHTSKANGEPFMYDIQINTKDGFIQIQDDANNFFRFDSKERQLEMVNSDNSRIEINKTNIFIESTDLIAMKSKNITQESTSHVIKANTLDITATTTHTGSITENGNINQTGNFTTSGKVTSAEVKTGKLGADAGGDFGGTMTAKKVVSIQPIEAPNV